MDQRNLFDRTEGERRKNAGRHRAEVNREEILQIARRRAIELVARRGVVCADDVQEALIRDGYKPDQLGNAAGSIFRGAEWEFTGKWIPSQRISNHGRMIREWRRARGDRCRERDH